MLKNSHTKSQSLPKSHVNPQKQKPLLLKPITLSSQLSSFSDPPQKLSLVHHNITTLDLLSIRNPPFPLSSLKLLYLSNNFITNLQHISQFPNLQTLALSYNQISKITNVRYLAKLGKLAVVSLEGNPVCKLPFYFAYVVGVGEGNCGLRIVDKVNISGNGSGNSKEKGMGMGVKREALRNWSVYEENMKQLLINYNKLVYLLHFSKLTTIHTAIKTAANNLSLNQPQQQPQPHHKPPQILHNLDFYLTHAQQDLAFLPTQYLMIMENVIYDDVVKIGARRVTKEKGREEPQQDENEDGDSETGACGGSRKRKSQMEIYVGSMYELLQRQRQKISQLKNKILDRHLSQTHTPNPSDIQIAQDLISSTSQTPQKQTQYYEWKTLARIFQKIKKFTQKKNQEKYTRVLMEEILEKVIKEKVRYGWVKIREWRWRKVVGGMVGILRGIGRRSVKNCFKKIYETAKEAKLGQMIRLQKNQRQRIQLQAQTNYYQQILIKSLQAQSHHKTLSKFFTRWSKQTQLTKKQHQKTEFRQKVQYFELRQEKLLNKIEILEKLLEQAEKKLKVRECVGRMPEKLADPKELLKNLQKDIRNCHRNTLQTSPQSQQRPYCRSPSSSSLKAIRKNLPFLDKQNTNPNNHNSGILTLQRKFNSSRKILKIQDHK